MIVVRNGFPHIGGRMPFTRPALDRRRSHYGTGFSWSPLRSPDCTRKEKDLPVLFLPHSFLVEFKKSDFYSNRVSLRFGKRSFPSSSPGLICSSFVPQEQIPPAYPANLVQSSYAHEFILLNPVHQSRIPAHGKSSHAL